MLNLNNKKIYDKGYVHAIKNEYDIQGIEFVTKNPKLYVKFEVK